MDRSIRFFLPTGWRTHTSRTIGTTTSDFGPISGTRRCRGHLPNVSTPLVSSHMNRRRTLRSSARGFRRRRSSRWPGVSSSERTMSAKNILLICGTLNQTKAMIAIGDELADHNCYYTPFYCDGHLLRASQRGQLDFTVLAGALRERSIAYMRQANMPIDDRGEKREYDLVVTCSDLI